MRRSIIPLAVMALLVWLLPATSSANTGHNIHLEIYGTWHCSNDYCTWGQVRDIAEFDSQNRWLIDRGDGRPSVNLVVLSFVHPLRLLNGTTDEITLDGVPRGMTQEVVDYFKNEGIRVMLSIGGITYTDAWDQALNQDAYGLGLKAAEVASRLGVGIEIDYERNRNPNLDGVQAFIDAYRSVHPYDATGNNHAARLTIDLAAGSRYLVDLKRKATHDWLRTDHPVLDYANAMVPARQPSASKAVEHWQEHIDGKSNYNPAIGPMAPAKLAVSLFISGGSRHPYPECMDFQNSLQNATQEWVLNVQPNGAGESSGALGYMFWAAEAPAVRGVTTAPPNSCENGVGSGATHFNIPIPMAPLRQE